MCGRYTLHLADLSALIAYFGVKRVHVPGWQPRYNIAPTQLAPVVLKRRPGDAPSLELLRFGLVPGFARREAAARGKAPSPLVNARVETITKLGAFRGAYRQRRCVVPATGFYEWTPVEGRRPKQPMWVHPEADALLTFAAIYEEAVDEHGEVIDTFAIVTTEPTPELREIHDRMPLVLGREGVERWLGAEPPSESALAALAGEVSKLALTIDRVSSAVSSPRNDDPRCIEPLAAADADAAPTHAALPTSGHRHAGHQLDLFGAPAPSKAVLTSGKRRAH